MLRIQRHRIVLPITAFYLYLAGSTPYLGHWDSFDYLKEIATHRLSALGIGRPVFVGYNVLLWESIKWVFNLQPAQVEIVVMSGTVLLGVIGVLLFQRLAHHILPPPAASMAALALAVSPVYAVYSGTIMTEVPMLVALIASALILWKPGDRFPVLNDVAGGILFGLAVGIREQALTLSAAFLWILFNRSRKNPSKLRSMLCFGIPASVVALSPALALYIYHPSGFLERTETWLRAIPMGQAQFRNNAEASLLYTFIICPGAWVAVAGAFAYKLRSKRFIAPASSEREAARISPGPSIPNPVLGILCCLVVPVVILWRDADVQMHPRYTLVALPASLILCASLYNRWVPSKKGTVLWAVVLVLFFGMALAAFLPFRQVQNRKIEFARVMRDSIPDSSLIIAGNYGPILDYYRAIGVRPHWHIIWSGWNWDIKAVEATIYDSWYKAIPVYLSADPSGWSYLEKEFLALHFMLKDCKKENIVPNVFRIYPPRIFEIRNSRLKNRFSLDSW